MDTIGFITGDFLQELARTVMEAEKSWTFQTPAAQPGKRGVFVRLSPRGPWCQSRCESDSSRTGRTVSEGRGRGRDRWCSSASRERGEGGTCGERGQTPHRAPPHPERPRSVAFPHFCGENKLSRGNLHECTTTTAPRGHRSKYRIYYLSWFFPQTPSEFHLFLRTAAM